MERKDYVSNAEKWLNKSIEALESHCRDDGGDGFIRTSEDKVPKDKDEKVDPSLLFSTATFQAYSSLLRCDEKGIICKKFDSFLSKRNFKKDIDSSENNKERSVILFEQILSCFSFTNRKSTEKINFEDFRRQILGKDEDEKEKRKKYFYPDPGQSPWFSLSLLTCQEYLNKIGTNCKLISIDEEKKLHTLIDTHIDYHMARYNVKELSFDPISLSIAVCCKMKLDSKFKKSPLFLSCLDAIVKQQYNDGSWPTGAAVSFSGSGDVIQQTSIQITSYLVDAVIDYKFLVDTDECTENILKVIIPPLRKLSQYMEATYMEIKNSKIKGWSSDRTKIKNFTETWITAYACRFFHKYYLAEKAYARIIALRKLGVLNFEYDPQNEESQKKWEEIIEPDLILKPKAEINTIIDPIIKKRDNGKLLINPEKNYLSFIICGPPGSGKTYVVECLAKKIGWPLVELSPSQFIEKGTEFIEDRSKEIFGQLFSLHHAVVFFDECDELFKERESKDEKNSTRTILNFLTASMLPKLQKLNKEGNVIFVIGTNFLSNIDKAVRRKGRFDHLILFDYPDDEARKKYYLDNNEKNEDEAKKFVERTKTCPAKELGDFLNNNDTAPIDDDYIKWCTTFADAEIEVTRYNSELKKLKKEKWKLFKHKS